MGNAGDIVLVRVNMHLLAWPRDLGNQIAPMSTSSFLLEPNPLPNVSLEQAGTTREGLYYAHNR